MTRGSPLNYSPACGLRPATATEDHLRALLERTFLKLTSLGCDVIGLGRQVQGKFASYPEWKDFDWGSRLSRGKETLRVRAASTAGYAGSVRATAT